MPLPVPTDNEKRSDFMSRCVSVVLGEGESHEQAQAICMSQYTRDAAPQPIVVRDRATYAISRREFTDNGYLKVPGRVARSGVQYYLASELGLTDRDPMSKVGVFRPPEEVFSDESLASYAEADVTIEHPGDMVNAATYKQFSVGHVTNTARRDEADYVEAPLIIKDADAIREVEDGKVELSAGYLAEYIPESGTTDAGEPYEFVQRNIRINHVALVSSARAGNQARLYDNEPQEAGMTVTVTLDGASIEVADKSTATLIEDRFNSLQKRAGDAEKQVTDAKAAQDAAEAKADKLSEDNEKLKAETSDEAITKRVKEIHDAQASAVKLAGAEFSCDSLDPMAIKRAALAVSRPSLDWQDKSDDYVSAAFDMSYAEKEAEEKDEKKRDKSAKDSMEQFASDFSGAEATNDAQTQREKVRQDFLDSRYGRKKSEEAK